MEHPARVAGEFAGSDPTSASAQPDVRFAPPAVCCRALPDGTFELASPLSLAEPLELIHQRLQRWSRTVPDRVLLAERTSAGWRRLSYAMAERLSAAVGAHLVRAGLSRERPILILGEASCAQGLLRLGALRAGIPFVPVSPAILHFRNTERLRAIMDRLTPGLVALSPACQALFPAEFRIDEGSLLRLDDAFVGSFESAPAGRMLDATGTAVTADTLAAIFLTSGSTGEPKAVEITHRMIAANQAAYGAVWPFLSRSPPVILDWLPWHHTFGGNDNIHKALWFGGSYYIDDGAPTPDRFERSLANIRDVAPTIHLDVPRGLALLVARLEADPDLFRRFFERLDVIFFAGAGLDAELWRRLRAIVASASSRLGRTVSLVSGYGTTEAGSTICLVHFPMSEPRVVGLPIPGLTLRLTPEGGKLEVCVKGPTVTPGYWRDPGRTAASFTAEGFFRTGDAARFIDPAEPARGLVLDGRLADDFKLASGTWVSVGPLRSAVLAALAPFASEVLVAGRDRDEIGIIVFLDRGACEAHVGHALNAPGGAVEAGVRAIIKTGLERHNQRSPSSSTAIRRAIIEAQPLSAANGELSDKGSVNQRLALQKREKLVEALFAEPPPEAVIVPARDTEVP